MCTKLKLTKTNSANKNNQAMLQDKRAARSILLSLSAQIQAPSSLETSSTRLIKEVSGL